MSKQQTRPLEPLPNRVDSWWRGAHCPDTMVWWCQVATAKQLDLSTWQGKSWVNLWTFALYLQSAHRAHSARSSGRSWAHSERWGSDRSDRRAHQDSKSSAASARSPNLVSNDVNTSLHEMLYNSFLNTRSCITLCNVLHNNQSHHITCYNVLHWHIFSILYKCHVWHRMLHILPTGRLCAKRDFQVWTYDSYNSTQIKCFIPVELVLFVLR